MKVGVPGLSEGENRRKPRDPTVLSSDALPACDGRTEQTDRHAT